MKRLRLFKLKTFYLIMFTFLCYGISFSANFGTNTAEFLKIVPEAIPAGMGEAYISVADDSSALFYNPGGLALLDRAELSLTHILWFNNINIEYFSFAQPFDGGMAAGFNALWIDFGSFDSTGGLADPVSVQNGLITAGFGKSL